MKKRDQSEIQKKTRDIKQFTLIALMKDDQLAERLVLKGGNAIDLAYCLGSRASMDIDFSMEEPFAPDEISSIERRIRKRLEEVFKPKGYVVFEVKMKPRPDHQDESTDVLGFWKGYSITFKLIEEEKFAQYQNDSQALTRHAVQIGSKGTISIDVSCYEHCGGKQRMDIEGYQMYVYSLEMIVMEKLRAICQQMPEYGPIVHRTRTSGTARARDFYDIHHIMEKSRIDLTTPDNKQLLKEVFKAKRAPLTLLNKIYEHRETHRSDFRSVEDTQTTGGKIQGYDYYFDYVVKMVKRLNIAGDE